MNASTQDFSAPTEATEDLIEVQLRLEEEMTARGAAAFFADVNTKKSRGAEDGTTHGNAILKGRLDAYAAGVQKWIDEARAGAPGLRSGAAYRKIASMPVDTLAFIALKSIVAGLSQVRNLQAVAITLGTAVEDEQRLEAIRADDKKAYESIVKGAKQRSSDKHKHIYAVRRATLMDDGWADWSPSDRMHVGVKMIDLCMETIGLIEITNEIDGQATSSKTMKYVAALPETLAWIEKKNGVTSLLRPVYEPMVVQPRDWSNPSDGGYLSTSIKPLKMVKSNNKAYMEELAHTDMPIVYEAVNTLQRTAWQINSQVLAVMNTLSNNSNPIAGLPHKEPLEMPVKPFDIETNEESRKEYRANASTIHLLNRQNVSKRVAFESTLDIANRYNEYRKIFMPYQLDFRGRIYAVPHLNPQGDDRQKSLLRFSNGKKLGESGGQWLAIQGANVIGNDKVTYEDRVQFILDNEVEICAIAADPFNNKGWCGSIGGHKVDKPWQTLAFCFEWAGYCEMGEDFVSKLPIALDGSCSGIQHFSAMLRDEIGGAAVNLIPADLPADVYRLVADKVKEQIAIDLRNGSENELKHNEAGEAFVKLGTKTHAAHWDAFGVSRKTTKRSVMTLAYGSSEFGFKDQIMEDVLRPAKLSGEDFPFDGDGYSAAAYMAKLIWVAVNQVLVKAGEAMKWLQEASSLASKENLPVRWNTPVGFPVMQAYPDMKDRRIWTALQGQMFRMTVCEAGKDGKLDSKAQRNGIAPNFVHSADAAHMMLTTVRAKQAGIKNFAMIHDSFGTTAGDLEVMYQTVRESFVEIYDTQDVLQNFRDDVAGVLSDKGREKLKAIPSKGTLSLSRVAESRYCFS